MELELPDDPVTEVDEVFISFHTNYVKMRRAGFTMSEACVITAQIVLRVMFGVEGTDSSDDDEPI